MAKGVSAITIKARNPGKKFVHLPLVCSTSKCECDFLLSYQGTTKKRECLQHARPFGYKPPQSKREQLNQILATLNLR